MRKKIKILCCACFFVLSAVFSLIAVADSTIADNYTVSDVKNLNIASGLPVSYSEKQSDLSSVSAEKSTVAHRIAELKLFGIFPIKNVDIKIEKSSEKVSVIGTPFGIKLYTHGVLVVKTSEFKAENKERCPVREAGIVAGDYILSVDGINVYTNAQMESIVNQSKGKISVKYSHNGKTKNTTVTPLVSDSDSKKHIGVWIRDSAAGIGTLTFFDSKSGVLAGLGHGLYDIDTEKLISVNNGCVLPAKIVSVTKGKSGITGTLNGTFCGNMYSNFLKNSHRGIYAKFSGNIKVYKQMEVAKRDEISLSGAYILTTVYGNSPKCYSCEVIKNEGKNSGSKCFMIKITDKDLLNKTGGIVQGMSGSPVIQNGKIIGAVTHVCVNL